MASTGNKPINVNLDFASGAKLKNLPSAGTSGEAVEYGQFNTALFFKQDLVSGGSGVDVTSNSISVDLATAGSAYDSLTLSGMAAASLNGTYTKLSIRGRVNAAGNQLDLSYGDLDHDWNIYEKDNGSGIYAQILCRVDQNDYTVASSWVAVLSTWSLSGYSYSGSGTGTIIPLIADITAVDNEVVTTVSDADGSGGYSPDADDANVAYGAAGAAAGLKFSNSKLSVDWADTTAQASSTRVFPSSVVKTYIDEQIVDAKDLSNHAFTNTTANLTGSPNNAQSAIEAAAAEIDTLDSQVSAIQTVNGTQDAYLEDHRTVLGVAQGADALTAWSAAKNGFLGTTYTVNATLDTIGTSFQTVYSNVGTMLGLGAFELDFGSGFTNLPNDASAKTIFLDIDAELSGLYSGLGAFWSPVAAVHISGDVTVSNPGTDVFGGETLTSGDRVLLTAQTLPAENGIYVFNGSSSAMTRPVDADADAEYTVNKTVQDLATGDIWAYDAGDTPVLGTDAITFSKKSSSVIADGTITSTKLDAALNSEIDNKCDKYAETVTFVAGVPQNVSHGLASQDVIVQCRDTSGNVVELEIDITDSGFVTINSPIVSGDFRVVVIG